MAWFRSPPSPPAGQAATVGVLLVNLGTPDAPSYWPIRRYLWAFLGDRRVVEACPWYWLPLLAGPILTFRPRKTARLYRSIWTEATAPPRTGMVCRMIHAGGLVIECGEWPPASWVRSLTTGHRDAAA